MLRALACILVAAFANGRAAPAETLELGAVLQLSGSQSEWGIQARRGADVAVELINESGFLPDAALKILYEDGKGSPSASISALRRLISVYGISVFLTQGSSVTMSLSPISNSSRVIQLDVGSVTPAYRRADDYTFRTAVTARQLARGLADSLLEDFKISACALLYVNDDYGEGVREVLSEHFKHLGGKVIREESFLPTDSDFRPQLLRLKRASPPAIVVTARYDKLGTILRQAKEIALETRFFGDVYSIESRQVLETAGEAAEGFTYAAPKFSAAANGAAMRFSERFRRNYQSDPVQLSAQAYDAVFALAHAAKQCGSFASACLKNTLPQVSFEGASGHISFDETGDVVSRPIEIRTVRGGRFVRK